MICNLQETPDGKWIVYYIENGVQMSQTFTDNDEAATFYSLKM